MTEAKTRGKPAISLRGLARAAIRGGAVALAIFSLTMTFPRKFGGDLTAFLASGHAIDHGLNPYLPPRELGWGSDSTGGPNANPPLSLLLFQPLSRHDPLAVARGLFVSSVALYLACLGLIWHRWPGISLHRPLWALAMTAPWYTVPIGQIYLLLLPLVLGAAMLLERNHETAAGLLIGALVAVKPNFVLWPALLLLAGYRRQALAAAFSALALSALPLLIYGPDVYRQWLASSEGFMTIKRVLPVDMSLLKMCHLIGLPWLVLPLGGAALAVAACRAWRRQLSLPHLHALALAVSLLVSPRAWVGYLVLLVPFLLQLRWSPSLRIVALTFVLPSALVWHLVDTQPALGWLTWPYPLAFLLLCVSLLLAPHLGSASERQRAGPAQPASPAAVAHINPAKRTPRTP